MADEGMQVYQMQKTVDYYLDLASKFENAGKLPQAQIAFKAAMRRDIQDKKST